MYMCNQYYHWQTCKLESATRTDSRAQIYDLTSQKSQNNGNTMKHKPEDMHDPDLVSQLETLKVKVTPTC